MLLFPFRTIQFSMIWELGTDFLEFKNLPKTDSLCPAILQISIQKSEAGRKTQSLIFYTINLERENTKMLHLQVHFYMLRM